MRCPVCESLQREHGVQSQLEAAAVIGQWRSLLLRSGESTESNPYNSDSLLASRKRQASISSQLHRHRQLAHPEWE
jgi:hypothetical protein